MGGGIAQEDGIVENCTIVSNAITGNTTPVEGIGGGVYRLAGSILRNCIIYDNYSVHASGLGYGHDIHGTNGVTHSCSPELVHDPSGSGNITTAPIFVDATVGNYRVEEESPTIEMGTNTAWIISATDLDGNDRLLNKFVDMGAYETFIPPSGTVLILQ